MRSRADECVRESAKGRVPPVGRRLGRTSARTAQNGQKAAAQEFFQANGIEILEPCSAPALDLGFFSYSHFSERLQAYAQTPLEFQRSAHVR